MNITEVTKAAGAHRRRKRVGRGEASGLGKTSGRGNKGCGARAGWRQRVLSEGGQMPIFRRLPKRGFSNFAFRTSYQVVNVGTLEERFEAGAHVTAATLAAAGLIESADGPLKILGDGELRKKLTIEAERFSEQAVTKIQAVGGVIKKLGPQPKKKFIKRPPPPKAPADEPKAKGEKGEKAEKGEKKKGKPQGEAAPKSPAPEAKAKGPESEAKPE